MRELNLVEVERVSGGFGFEEEDEPATQPRVPVIGQRIHRYTSWEIDRLNDALQGAGVSISELIAAGGAAAQQALDDVPDPESCQGQQIMDLIETRDGLLERINELRDPSSGGDPDTFADRASDMIGNSTGVYSFGDYLQINSDNIFALVNGDTVAAALERDVAAIDDQIQTIAENSEGCDD